MLNKNMMYHSYNSTGNTFADIYNAWADRYQVAESLALREECSHILSLLLAMSSRYSTVPDALDQLLIHLSTDVQCGEASLHLLQRDIFVAHYPHIVG